MNTEIHNIDHSPDFVPNKQWLDGDDEQEDELDDVSKGILDAPTDDEGPGRSTNQISTATDSNLKTKNCSVREKTSAETSANFPPAYSHQ
jgi:hypothetical protein